MNCGVIQMYVFVQKMSIIITLAFKIDRAHRHPTK